MTTEPTSTTRVTTTPVGTEPSTQPVHDDVAPVSLGTALWPWGIRGAGDLADVLSRAVGVVGNAPGVVRVSVRCPDPGSEVPRVVVVVTDPGSVRRVAAEQASRVADGWVEHGTSRSRTGLVELADGPTWSAVLHGVGVFVYADHQSDHQSDREDDDQADDEGEVAW